MNSVYWVIFMGLLINIPSLAPVLLLRKAEKKVKVSLSLRFFLLNAVVSDAIAEHHTKIQAVSNMAGVSCYRAVCCHAGTNGKICA